VSQFHIYIEAGFSVHDNVSGNQLVSKQVYKVNLSYGF
jgi:hypothetical protein